MQTNHSRLALGGLLLSAVAAFSQPLDLVQNSRAISPSRRGTAALAFDLEPGAMRIGGPGDFRMQLPGRGGAVSLQRQRFEDRGGEGDGLWTGLADGRSDTEVLLTVKNGFMAGTIRYGEDVYEVRPTADGQVVELLDFSAFPSCAGGELVQDLPAGDGAVAVTEPSSIMDRAALRAVPVTAAVDPSASLVHAVGDPIIVDVMSVYTPQARAAAGGTAQIEAVIQAAVDAANQAFINSSMAMRYRLVRVAEVAYNDSGNISADLAWVRTSADVAAMRDQSGADLVSLVVDNGGRYCGVGYVMRTVSAGFASVAFQVTVRSCAVGNLTFAHEHGHNLGMEHDPANSVPANQASYPWSFGHFVDAAFRTVMSYATVCPSGCRRIPYFSNPDVSYLGYPTGVANAYDNARTSALTAPVVAAFRTAPGAAIPATPTGLNAVATSAGQVNLTWTDTSTNETGFKIERSTAGGSYTQIAALGPNFVAFADLTVTQTTAYSYRIRSYNANGDSAYSNLASATTPLPPAPLSPSLLVATAAGATQVNLTWADNSGNETGFRLERSANGAGFVELVALPAGTTAFADSSASASTTYEYRVRASNAGGNSAYSNTATVTTPAAASAPSAPSGLTATASSATQVNLSWTDTASNETGFKIERSASGGAFTQIATAGANSTAYFDTSVSAGIAYAYRVLANNSSGNSGYSNTATVTTPAAPTAPAAPAGLGASVLSATQVNLTWADASSNETSFKVERSVNGSGFVQIGAVGANATGYADLTTIAGTAYAYRVRASNSVGDSAYSNTATANTPAAPTAPSAPVALTASAPSSTQVNLSWADTSANESGFRVERSTSGGGFVEIAALGANAASFADFTATAGTAYAYRVKAYNGIGDSGYSNTATVTTPALQVPAAPTGLIATAANALQINLSWADNANNEAGYKIERSSGLRFAQIAVTAANATSFSDVTVSPGTLYFYRVRATNAVGDSAPSVIYSVRTP